MGSESSSLKGRGLPLLGGATTDVEEVGGLAAEVLMMSMVAMASRRR